MTSTCELDELIAKAKASGASVHVVLDSAAAREGRRIYESIQVRGLPGIGPYPMAPIVAAECLREALAEDTNEKDQ